MSVHYVAYTFLGQKITEEDLLKRTIVPGCKHKVPDKTKFCPQCGAPSKREEVTNRPEYNEDSQTFAGLQVLISGETNDVYVGIIMGETSYDAYDARSELNVVRLTQDEIKIHKILASLRLWDPKSFGLWTILDESY